MHSHHSYGSGRNRRTHEGPASWQANALTAAREFKRQVVQEYLAGVKLYSLARRHGVSITEIRTWADQYLYPSQGSHRV